VGGSIGFQQTLSFVLNFHKPLFKFIKTVPPGLSGSKFSTLSRSRLYLKLFFNPPLISLDLPGSDVPGERAQGFFGLVFGGF